MKNDNIKFGKAIIYGEGVEKCYTVCEGFYIYVSSAVV